MEETPEEVTKFKVVKDRFDLRNLHLPTVTIASIVIFCVWLTWSASNERSNIQTQLTEISNKVNDLTSRESKIDELTVITSKRLDSIENKLPEDEKMIDENYKKLQSADLKDIMSRRDHLIWCLETQIKNPGWKCIDDGNKNGTSENVLEDMKKK